MKHIIILMIAGMLLLSCSSAEKSLKHLQSSMTGLNREVILYDCQGDTLGLWLGEFIVEDNGGTCSFINDSGHVVILSGTFVIRETSAISDSISGKFLNDGATQRKTP